MENNEKNRAGQLGAVRYITVTAMSVAIGTVLAIIAKQLFGNLPVRLDISVFAVLFMSLYFGWPSGAITYVFIDILSSIFFYPPFLPITFCKLLSGLLFDLFLRKAHPRFPKTLLLFLLNGLVIDCVCMAVALYWLSGGNVLSLILVRIGSAMVNVGLFLFFVYVLYPKLEPPLDAMLKKAK